MSQPVRLRGLLTPLGIAAGARALEVGCGRGDLSIELLRTGVSLIALEEATDDAQRARQRTLDHGEATVVEQSFADWLADTAGTIEPFDVIAMEAHGIRERDVVMDEVVAAARQLLSPSGILVFLSPHRPTLSTLLATTREANEVGYTRAELAARLAAGGLRVQRWLVPYAEEDGACVTVDARAWQEDDGAAVVSASVRTPLATLPDMPAVAPRTAFGAASQAGAAADLAETVLVVAGPQAPKSASGLIWLLPPHRLAPAWRKVHVLDLEGGAWNRRTAEPRAPASSGPFVLEPSTVAIPVGENGEDVLATALMQGGLLEDASIDELRRWWSAASRVIEDAQGGRHPIDLAPRHFRVRAGRWAFMPPDETFRFRIPPEVLAFGALVETLESAVMGRGWVPGIALTSDVAAAAAALLSALGFDDGQDIVRLWLAIESDRHVRQDVAELDRDEVLAMLLERLRRPLGADLESWPLQGRLADSVRAAQFAAQLAHGRHELQRIESERAEHKLTRETLANLQLAVEKQRAAHDVDRERVADLRRRVARRAEQAEALETSLGQARVHLETSKARVASQADQISSLSARNAELEEQLKAAQAEQARLADVVADQTALIVTLRERSKSQITPPSDPSR